VLFIFLTGAPAFAQDPASLAELKAAWEKYKAEHRRITRTEVIEHYSVPISDSLPHQGQVVYTGARKGDAVKLSIQRNAEPARLSLGNSNYFATLLLPASAKPSLSSLSVFPRGKPEGADEERLSELAAVMNRAHGIQGMFVSLDMLLLEGCKVTSITDVSEHERRITFTTDLSKLPKSIPPGPDAEDIEWNIDMLRKFPAGHFVVDSRYGWAFTKFRGQNDTTQEELTEHLSDYRRVDKKLWFPFVIERNFVMRDASGSVVERLVQSTRKAAMVSTEEVPATEFRLPFYGIAEPADTDANN
jgi:hypothetical protein